MKNEKVREDNSVKIVNGEKVLENRMFGISRNTLSLGGTQRSFTRKEFAKHLKQTVNHSD